MALIYKYYLFVDIPVSLMVGLPFDIAHFLSMIIIEILLCSFLVITLVLFVISIKQGKNECTKKPVKALTIIMPIIFVILLQFSIAIPFIITDMQEYPFQEPSVAVLFTDLQNSGNDVDTYSICEKNALGKAGYYEKNTFFEDKGDITYLCSYQESDLEFIKIKFERIDNKYYALENNEINDDYIIYYEQDDVHTSYSLLIEDGNKYFVSTFDSYENDYLDNYSKEQFVSDSLGLYYEWRDF